MRTYAEGTSVSAHRTLEQLDRLLRDAGAKDVTTGLKQELFAISFAFGERAYRFSLPLPTDEHFKTYRPKRSCSDKTRSAEACEKLRAQTIREKYRALYATIKAKLVSVQAGIETFEEAFLAHAVTRDGTTVSQWMLQQDSGLLRKALPPGGPLS